MPISDVWTSPAEGGALDRTTNQPLTEAIYEAILSNLLHLGGTGGTVPNIVLATDVPLTRSGMRLSWVDDDTIQVGVGSCRFTGGAGLALAAPTSVTFTALDTGARTVGRDYSVHATADGIKLHLIPVDNSALGALYPSGYTASNSRLLGYFHNGKDYVGGGADGAIFQYSVTSNDLLNESYPYRAHPDLPAGVPLPGMVKIGPLAIGIYQASREDATASAAGSSAYPTSRYGVVPWGNVSGWDTMAALRNSGLRLPSWEEWLGSVEFNPGSSTPARMNGNTGDTNPPSSSDDATQTATNDPTRANRALTGSGPRTSTWGSSAAGRSWYSPGGLSDPVGNVWEWVATFFGGLKTTAPGSAVAWDTPGGGGYEEGDQAWNFQGQAYNPDTGGYTEGLPGMPVVGGDWSSGAAAGVRAAYADYSAGGSASGIGFRPAR